MDWEYESDEALDTYQESDSYDTETDEMLDSLLEEADEDITERSRKGKRRGRPPRRKGVPTAKGAQTYRSPAAPGGYVTQQQFKEALGRVGQETKRNAEGIKTVNVRVGKLDGQVTDLATVSKSHSKRIGTIDTRMKMDGALDFASAFSMQTDTAGTTTLVPDFTQLLRGAVKNGVLGDGKGALSNPWVVGGIGLALRPGFLGSILTPK
jgi:hypothetical protein